MKRILLLAIALLAFVYIDANAQSRRSSGNSAQSRSSSGEVKSSRQTRSVQSTRQQNSSSQRSQRVSPSTQRQSSVPNARSAPVMRSGSSGSSKAAATSRRSANVSQQNQNTVPSNSVSNARSSASSSRSTAVQNSSRRTREVSSQARSTNRTTVRYTRESSTRSRAINARNNVETRKIVVNNGPAHRYVSTRRYVHHHRVTYHVKPMPLAYRVRYRPFRAPMHVHVVWSPAVYRSYCTIYPTLVSWNYSSAYRIHTISAYEAYRHVGEIRNVYGKVYDAYYASETDEYFLYVGEVYPYQDFTVVVPGPIARKYSRVPERFFLKEHIVVNGLITAWENNPEIVIGRADQLRIY